MILIIEEAKQQECIRCESGNKDVITSTYDQCGLEGDSKHLFICQGEKMMKAKNEGWKKRKISRYMLES